MLRCQDSLIASRWSMGCSLVLNLPLALAMLVNSVHTLIMNSLTGSSSSILTANPSGAIGTEL